MSYFAIVVSARKKKYKFSKSLFFFKMKTVPHAHLRSQSFRFFGFERLKIYLVSRNVLLFKKSYKINDLMTLTCFLLRLIPDFTLIYCLTEYSLTIEKHFVNCQNKKVII